MEEVRREQSAARQTLLGRLLPKLREMAVGPTGDEASATGGFRPPAAA
jgi:hypothetical protein